MSRKKLTEEQKRINHVESAKKSQKKRLKRERVLKLHNLVNDVFKLETQGMTALEIAIELEDKGYIGTKKERK